MSLAQITEQALALPTIQRRQLIAQLVAAGTEENQNLKTLSRQKSMIGARKAGSLSTI